MNEFTLSLHSFGYQKSGIPQDTSNNKGGHVFDCRALPNPGLLVEFKTLTGLDKETEQFLESKPIVSRYLDHVWTIIQMSVDQYVERGYTRLMVSFGCTGGQHRSVYCANQTMLHFNKQDINVELVHHELAG